MKALAPILAALWASAALADPRVVVLSEELGVYRALVKGIALAESAPLEIVSFDDASALKSKDAVIAIGPRAAGVLGKASELKGVICMVPRLEAYALDRARVSAVRVSPSERASLKLLQTLFPKVSRVGVVHAPRSSRTSIERLKTLAAGLKQPIEIVPIAADAVVDVEVALESASDVDALFLIGDPVALHENALKAQRAFSRKTKVPMVAPDDAFTRDGATFALVVDWVDLGSQVAAIAARMDAGDTPVDLGVVAPAAREIAIRLDAIELDPKVFARLRRFAADTGRRVRYVP